MKKIFALVLAGTALMSSPVYASGVEMTQNIKSVENERASRGILYPTDKIDTADSAYTTSPFPTSYSNWKDITVRFTNTGKSSVTVSLYNNWNLRDTLVGSFEVAPGSSDYAIFPALPRTMYYINITNSSNTGIQGSLEAIQLD